MKKLLFVYDNMMTGGTTTALLSLLNRIDYTKYSVDLLLFQNSGPFFDKIPERVNLLEPAYRPILSKSIPAKYWKMLVFAVNGGLFGALRSYFLHRGTPKGIFRNILMHHGVRAQVALSRSIKEDYFAAIGYIEGWSDYYVLSQKVKAKKKIAWIHLDYLDSYLLPEVDQKVLSKADNLIVVADACKVSMQRTFPQFAGKLQTIENITSRDFIISRSREAEISLPCGYLNLCTVCRCSMQMKGLDRMVEILSALKEKQLLDDVRWHLIGDGKDMDKLKAMVRAKGLTEHVVFWGHSNNPLPILRKMDAFVLASRYEGKPIAVSEALCLGVPCIVTNYASANEQVRNGINGLIAPNSSEGLYDALESVILNRTSLNALKDGAMREKYDNMNELQKLYAILGDRDGI